MKKLIIAILVAITVITSGTYFVIASEEITSQTILITNQTVISQPIEYPTDSPLITSKIIVIPSGVETCPHTHDYPLVVYILEGEVTIDYDNGKTITFVKGDSFVEAVNYTHNGKNTGDKPVKILTVELGKQ